jgi:hypothetical protein
VSGAVAHGLRLMREHAPAPYGHEMQLPQGESLNSPFPMRWAVVRAFVFRCGCFRIRRDFSGRARLVVVSLALRGQ